MRLTSRFLKSQHVLDIHVRYIFVITHVDSSVLQYSFARLVARLVDERRGRTQHLRLYGVCELTPAVAHDTLADNYPLMRELAD